jgi:hypothetical protein
MMRKKIKALNKKMLVPFVNNCCVYILTQKGDVY